MFRRERRRSLIAEIANHLVKSVHLDRVGVVRRSEITHRRFQPGYSGLLGRQVSRIDQLGHETSLADLDVFREIRSGERTGDLRLRNPVLIPRGRVLTATRILDSPC